MERKHIYLAAALVLVVIISLLAIQTMKPPGLPVDLSLVNKEKMVFTSIGPDDHGTYLAAIDLVNKLPRQRAIIVVEPKGINLASFAHGDNDSLLLRMFGYLSEQGFAGAEATFVPFSEYNDYPGIPDPKLYVPAVNHFAALAKSAFPEVKIGALLDCRSNLGYRDKNESGHYGTVSLLPYIGGLDKKNVTVLFFQGFPRVAGDENVTRAMTFLNADRAIEAAAGLGTKEITFVTGTAAVYGAAGSQKITHTPAERSQIVGDIQNQIGLARQAGYGAKLVIFAENKEKTQADWSYARSNEDIGVLKKFVGGETASGVEVSIFDPENEVPLSRLA